ncbi:uncharacterized protein [Palaemon carinicauda]|uniref:uncharacterized protein n=1 Tax=Palaemon carinicauda TaxID=392227 RepID=UPI0035B647CF
MGSSIKFLTTMKEYSSKGVIASLDVKFRFTNVPVDETIQLILDQVYTNNSTPPLNILEHAYLILLEICTKKAPFSTNRRNVHIQKDGILMGFHPGILLANFYNDVIEEHFYARINPPVIYFRYINNTSVKSPFTECVDELCRTFEECSSLRFMLEHRDKDYFPFLYNLVLTAECVFDTAVHTKPTNLGLCLKANSERTDRYKALTIQEYICRAFFHRCSLTESHNELYRITQVVVNNSYSNRKTSQQPVNIDEDNSNQQLISLPATTTLPASTSANQ